MQNKLKISFIFIKKGLKGYKNTKSAIVIKTKENHLMRSQLFEVCRRIFSKPVTEKNTKNKINTTCC